MSDRVLILSWEYPPVIEGGLARHVRKLAEALVRQGVTSMC
jgi:glycogen(starch) synthase